MVPCGCRRGSTESRRNAWEWAQMQLSAECMPRVSWSILDVNKSCEEDCPHSSPLNLAHLAKEKWSKRLDIHHNRWAISEVGSWQTCYPFYVRASKIEAKQKRLPFRITTFLNFHLTSGIYAFYIWRTFALSSNAHKLQRPSGCLPSDFKWELDRNSKLQEIFKLSEENYFNLRVSMRLSIKYV